VEFLLGEGYDVFILDWGVWGPEDRNATITDLVVRYLPRAIRHASEAADEKVTLLGYCIGGVLATCFAALHPDAPIRNLVLFTTPIDFADAGQFGVWTAKGSFPIDRIRETLDVVPGELIDVGAKMLNPIGSTIGTYLQLYERLDDPGFDPRGWQAMYRWVNESTPFPAAAYHQWITEFYQENRLSRGTLLMDGRPVRLAMITLPFLNVAARADTIAPRATTSLTLSKVGSHDKSEILLEGGHVGIVVGRSARTELWPQVSDWLGRHD
jgi:polyhydroxyalkanoate synthase